jgi:hypothetical protein
VHEALRNALHIASMVPAPPAPASPPQHSELMYASPGLPSTVSLASYVGELELQLPEPESRSKFSEPSTLSQGQSSTASSE